MSGMRIAFALCGSLALLLAAPGLRAELAAEQFGRMERLPSPPGRHWAFVGDLLAHRYALVDLDTQRFLGQISTGYLNSTPLFARSGNEFYVVETYLSRGSRGERSDVVTIYQTETLLPVAEVLLPPKRAINASPAGNAALSDDDRFLAVFNQDPGSSLSIVDVRERRLAGEIPIAGCGCAFAAGARRFVSLCQDGALLSLTLDERGQPAALTRSQSFFDPEQDPVTEKAVRHGNRWLFASFDGWLYPVDVSESEPRFLERWSLLSDAERSEGFRIGGNQHLAVHEKRGRLYSLVHEGGEWSHKDPGSELWVYDLASQQRLARIELASPGLTFMGRSLEFGQDWPWPLNRISPGIVGLMPAMIGNVAVTQDDHPLILTTSEISGSLVLHDLDSGELLRRVPTGNFTASSLHAPFGARP